MPFLTGWTKRIPVTLPMAYIGGSLTNFPGLFDLSQAPTATRQAIAAGAKADGSDLRVTLADETTVLSHYLRPGTYSNAGGLASGLLQPLYPSLTSGVDGNWYCYYGNASAPDVSNSAAVFGAAGAGDAAAYGFGDGVTLDLTDLTGNGNNGTNNGATAAAGQVGGAASFDATGYIEVADDSALQFGTGSFTMVAWVKPSSMPDRAPVFYKSNWPGAFYLLDVSDNNLLHWEFGSGSTDLNQDSSPGSSLTPNVWSHVAVALDRSSNQGKMYINGSQSGPTKSLTVSGSVSPGVVLGIGSTHVNKYLGLIDEPRISPVARSAPWVYLDWAQVANQSSVVTWGAEQSSGNRRRRLLMAA